MSCLKRKAQDNTPLMLKPVSEDLMTQQMKYACANLLYVQRYEYIRLYASITTLSLPSYWTISELVLSSSSNNNANGTWKNFRWFTHLFLTKVSIIFLFTTFVNKIYVIVYNFHFCTYKYGVGLFLFLCFCHRIEMKSWHFGSCFEIKNEKD